MILVKTSIIIFFVILCSIQKEHRIVYLNENIIIPINIFY